MPLSDQSLPALTEAQMAAIDDLIASDVTPTMQDVANIAQVSAMTVSRALRPGTPVSAGIRARILYVVERLDYAPDESARQFASGRSSLVAVLVPTLENELCTAFLRDVSNALASSKLQMIFGVSDHETKTSQDQVSALLRRNPEGVIVWGADHPDKTRRLLGSSGIPIVETADIPDAPIDNAVGIAHADAGRAMVYHLYERGYRRIAHLGHVAGEQSLEGKRRRGYYDALSELDLPTHLVIDSGQQRSEIAQGSVDLTLALRQDPLIDAAVCTSDHCAFGALSHCQRVGAAVPNQIAIIGFGDSDLARAALPPLSSVRLPVETFAKRSVAMLLAINRISDAGRPDPAPQIETLPFEVISRESSKAKI